MEHFRRIQVRVPVDYSFLTAANALCTVLRRFAPLKPSPSVTPLSVTCLLMRNGKGLNMQLISHLLEIIISNHQREGLSGSPMWRRFLPA